MIITIAGPSGSGKDTVAEIVSKKLSMPIISMGNLRRKAAKDRKMTLEEFNEWSLKNPKEGDEYFDNYQKKYGLENDNFIMISRLGWHFIPHSKKIYIDVDSKVGAERVFNQKKSKNERNERDVNSVEEQMSLNKKRVDNDVERYKILYNINPYKKDNYDIIIDSTNLTIQEVVNELMRSIQEEK